jgi:peptidoglycan/LPS O-acetylase OafA/YrhL
MTENIPLMVQEEDEHAEWPQTPAGSRPRSCFGLLIESGRMIWPMVKSALPNYCVPSRISSAGNSPTAYLDALRGYAAFIVYIYHAHEKTGAETWRRYPFVATLFSGPGMVSVFFVISGYALGYSLLLNMHRKEGGRMLNSLASSTFRRYMRLYGSSSVALLIAFIVVRLRLYNGVYGMGVYQNSFHSQLLHWLADVFTFCNPFARNVTDLKDESPLSSVYLPQMWTIPVEYRGSVFLFAFCTAICRLTPRARMLAMWLVVVASYCWQEVYIAEFTVGLFIAQLGICRHPERVSVLHHLPTANDEKPRPSQSLISKLLHSGLFIVSLILLGQVDGGQANLLLWGRFPWEYLNKFIPFWWTELGRYVFWLGWGSFALVYSLEFYPALQRPLSSKVSRYLGDISFGLYAMHVPFGMGIAQLYLNPWRETHLGESNGAYIFIALIDTFIVITAADYFTKVDRVVVRGARQLQTKLFSKWMN